ncbi:zinc ribbon domain-containing protein [Bradyrhizobium sp. UFLA05-153]
MATCPFCLEDTKDGAKKCPHCQSDLVRDQDHSQKVVYILDQGLVTFAKFALVLFGLFAVVLYTALGFHIEDSVKQIDEKSKSVAELQAKAKDISIEIQKSALSDQKELQKWKEELQQSIRSEIERK